MKKIDVFNFEDLDNVEVIYRNYASAMGKRRKGSELPFENFAAYICQEDVFCYQYGSSYIFGVVENGIFIPTHFAPAGLKEGIDLIKELKSYDNVVFVVTADLSAMLKRLGFILLPFKVQKYFHGEKVLKNIAVSSLIGFISILLKNKLSFIQNRLHKIYCALSLLFWRCYCVCDMIGQKFSTRLDNNFCGGE